MSGTGAHGTDRQPGREAGLGLRERKKLRTYQAVSDIAITLFLEKGFEKVSVAEIAAAAEISKPTLFRYFPTKEDLVLHRFADHEDEAARVVRGRPAGRTPLEALRLNFLDGLERRDPVTGLNDAPEVLAFHRLIYGTASVVARLSGYVERSENALTEALSEGDDSLDAQLDARLAAGQIIAVQRLLALDNWRRISGGETADAVHPAAVAAAERGFAQLGTGLTRYAAPGAAGG
ncbi:TetR/AcrR family transcriptional regulator [Streptomyces sp. NPDC002004]